MCRRLFTSLFLGVTSITAHADCFTNAATTYGVKEDLLRAIAKVESNYNPEALNPKSHALGVMQIHPTNFNSLQKYDITEPDLHQPCTNINVGAWILAGFIRQYGPVWRAVGAYGVGNGKGYDLELKRTIYAEKVIEAMKSPHRKKIINPVKLEEKPHIKLESPAKPVMVVLE
jgi:soluble lytic murein transglycosylase-like protein